MASTLDSALHIPKSWFYDINSFNGTELLGGAIGVVAVGLYWNRKDVRAFSRIIGGLGLASVASANPALAVITVAALAKAFMDAREKQDYTEFVEGLVKGGVGTGVLLGTSAAVGTIGGPVFVGILAGVCAGVLANKAMDRVDVAEVREYLLQATRQAVGNQQA